MVGRLTGAPVKSVGVEVVGESVIGLPGEHKGGSYSVFWPLARSHLDIWSMIK